MKNVLFVTLAIMLFSCSSAMDKKYSDETLEKDLVGIRKELSEDDLNLLGGSIIRLKMQDKELKGMRYSEILEDGREWKKKQDRIEAEQKALAEKSLREEQERIKRLTEAVAVTCFDKGFASYNYQDYITYKFAIQNKSNKSIRALKGVIVFTNLFDDEIYKINFVYDQPIEAGETAKWDATTDYNQFMDDHVAMKNKELKDMKVVWKPEKIIFEDGSSLE